MNNIANNNFFSEDTPIPFIGNAVYRTPYSRYDGSKMNIITEENH